MIPKRQYNSINIPSHPLYNRYSHLAGTTAQYKTSSKEESVELYTEWITDQIDENNQEIIEAIKRLDITNLPDCTHKKIVVEAYKEVVGDSVAKVRTKVTYGATSSNPIRVTDLIVRLQQIRHKHRNASLDPTMTIASLLQ